ncbi:MAG: ThiF family adenylyltransferase [Candidatus Cloacimonetes bacterium]|nr:ThiF family adenylyltransferase [Candidatus Cloacimonadota bacterium]MBL7124342.1 ThiF family adenylyltransferase [Actinomycetota bacterium]
MARKLLIQNPDSEESLQIEFDENKLIKDLANYIKSHCNMNNEPILYTYFKKDKCEEIAHKTLVENSKVILPDDMTIKEVLDSLLDPEIPIYIQSIELNEKLIFQLRTDRFSRIGYNTGLLNKKSVLIGGVGLLGNEIAYNLAVLGVGNIIVVDYGFVDWYNIYRQPLFTIKDVYKKKVEVVKEKLSEMTNINVVSVYKEVPCFASEPKFSTIKKRLNFFDSIIKKSDIVIGCFDTFSARAVFQMLCIANNKPFISSALNASMGSVSLFNINGNPCYCCGSNPDSFNDKGACTLSPLESQKIIGGITTKFAIEILSNVKIKHNYFTYYSNNIQMKYVTTSGSPKCIVCGENGISKYSSSPIEFIYSWLFNRNDLLNSLNM